MVALADDPVITVIEFREFILPILPDCIFGCIFGKYNSAVQCIVNAADAVIYAVGILPQDGRWERSQFFLLKRYLLCHL